MEWNPDERRRPAAHRGGHMAPIYAVANSSLDNCETIKQFPVLFEFFQRPLSVAQTGGENQRCQPKMTRHEAQDLIGCLVLVDSVNCVADDISAITKVNLVGGALRPPNI